MNDQTKKLTTPSGKEVEFKKDFSARELNIIREISTGDAKVNTTTGESNIETVSGKILLDVQQKLIEILVVSFDGLNEKVIDRILDGTPRDYDFISNECLRIFKENLTPAK